MTKFTITLVIDKTQYNMKKESKEMWVADPEKLGCKEGPRQNAWISLGRGDRRDLLGGWGQIGIENEGLGWGVDEEGKYRKG